MELVGVAHLFVSNTIWRVTGLRSAGRALIHALSSKDETLKTIAGMFLVRTGSRAEPLLREALHRRESLPLVLTILGDIGDPKVVPELRQFSRDHNPEVAQAARDALHILSNE